MLQFAEFILSVLLAISLDCVNFIKVNVKLLKYTTLELIVHLN